MNVFPGYDRRFDRRRGAPLAARRDAASLDVKSLAQLAGAHTAWDATRRQGADLTASSSQQLSSAFSCFQRAQPLVDHSAAIWRALHNQP